MKKKIALSIAGSDSSGGAGVQADLKAFAALDIHGVTAITCITAQNTKHVKTIYKLPTKIVEDQIDTILDDMHPSAAKTGMLYDKDIVNVVAKKIKQYDLKTVVDPVMAATSGDVLSKQDLTVAIKSKLTPKAYIITPNVYEASRLTGMEINTPDDVKKACKELYKIGPKYVLIKGGHLEGKYVQDTLFDGKKFTVFSLPIISNKKAHGSGCTLSALITGLISLGKSPEEAIGKAKHILWAMLHYGYIPGMGADVLNHSLDVTKEISSPFLANERFTTWLELKTSVDKLLSFLSKEYVPEVGLNMGYALPNAKELKDVCAIDGRIVKTKDRPIRCGRLDFGVSEHIASIILAAMDVDRSNRCAINIKYSEENLQKCKKTGLSISSFDRTHESKNVNSTMEWGTGEAIKRYGAVPDIIYDKGGIGKEPMIRVLGVNPKEVLSKVRATVDAKVKK